MLTAAAPWLSRRSRRAAWALLVGLMVTRFVSTPVSFDSLEAALVGWLCGAGVLVLIGAPSRRPTPASIIAGLAAIGVPMQQLDRAGVDARGSTPYFGVTDSGERLFVKALGDDERNADILFRLYRRISPRDFGDEKPFSTLRRAVEHEAFVALAARDLGVRTPRLGPSPTPIPTASWSPTRQSKASPSTGSTATRSPTRCSPRVGVSSGNCDAIASLTATYAWRTSSSTSTTRSG